MKPGADPAKAVKAALLANAGIAVAKLVAALLSGSATMLAEGVHSIADTANQSLLLLGMRLSSKRATALHPFGRDSESYFWAFIVSLLLFFLGGVFAIYEGVHKLLANDDHQGSLVAPLAVLGISILLEAGSFVVALGEFNKSRGERPFFTALFAGKDPVIPLVLLEDSGAVLGLVIAFASILMTALTGRAAIDGIGSILIGVLLCTIGLFLARDTRSLLIGEGIDDETRAGVLKAANQAPGVQAVTQLLSLHLGPASILLALKVRFAEGSTLSDVERIIDDIEERIRAAEPRMKRIFIEPDGDYDAARDPDAVGPPLTT
ncbi:MAG: cation diffusion facilitator family transporter [Polyangiaceae bacterium]